MNTSDLAIA